MKLSIFNSLLCFIVTVRATEWVEKRSITTVDIASVNIASIDSQIASLTELYGAPASSFSISFISTPGGNLLTPPQTLIGPILSAVPATVLAQLVNPAARASIASEFKAGKTPEWYATLPSGVKSYVGALNAQIASGAVTISDAAVVKTTLPVSSGALNSAIASGSDLASEFSAAQITATTGGVASSTSKGMAAAAKPTGGLAGSVAGVVGALGVVLFL